VPWLLSAAASRPRMDWLGAVLACAGLFAIVFSQAEAAGLTSTLIACKRSTRIQK
jgi:hypothetical protein